MNIQNLTIKMIHQGLIKKEFSALEITKLYLEKIKSEDEKICAFLEVSENLALLQANQVDEDIKKGKKISMLAGIPSAIKDNILVQGLKCTAGSKILQNYHAPYDATCVKKLKKNKVIILGKTNLDEFAMGSSTERSAFKITKNPKDLTRVAGGSSGGSAAAIASGECCFALGSDTGGSIRQPACFCGVVGLKPTYGTVSRYGLIAFASSLDQIGPLAKNVEDAKIVFEAIKGEDLNDSTSIKFKSKLKVDKIKELKIGIPKEYFKEKGINPGVKELIIKIINKLQQEKIKFEEISLVHTKYAVPCYYIIATCEASANLARYDGIRYGILKSKFPTSDLLDEYLKIRGEGFGEEVKRRIMLGTYALSAGYYEAYYLRAQKVRTLIRQDFEKAFQQVDLIFTPVSPFPAFKIGEKIKDPLKMYLADIFTVSVNLAGVPALSLPIGEINGLPIGLQIIGAPFSELKIFKVGEFIEDLLKIIE